MEGFAKIDSQNTRQRPETLLTSILIRTEHLNNEKKKVILKYSNTSQKISEKLMFTNIVKHIFE